MTVEAQVRARKKGSRKAANAASGDARKFPLRLIRSDKELEKATECAYSLSEKAETRKLSRAEDDYLEVLLLLIERYEDEHYPFPDESTPLERIQHLVKDAGMSASDLGRLLGNRSLGSKLLNGQRELSKAHIRKLAKHFRLDPGYFL